MRSMKNSIVLYFRIGAQNACEIQGCHGSENANVGLLDSNVV